MADPTDAVFVNPIIIENVYSGSSGSYKQPDLKYVKGVSQPTTHNFPFTSLGLVPADYKDNSDCDSIGLGLTVTFFRYSLTNSTEYLQLDWGVPKGQAQYLNYFKLIILKNSEIDVNKRIVSSVTHYKYYSNFEINDRFDVILIPVLFNSTECVLRENASTNSVIRQQILDIRTTVETASALDLTALNFEETTSYETHVISDVLFDYADNGLKISFTRIPGITNYKIQLNDVLGKPSKELVIPLEELQNIIYLPDIDTARPHVIGIVPIDTSGVEIQQPKNYYLVDFEVVNDPSDINTEIETKWDDTIPAGNRLKKGPPSVDRNDGDLIGEVHDVIKKIALKYEDVQYAKYTTEDVKTEFANANTPYENFIVGIDDLTLSRAIFGLKGTETGFLMMLHQAGIDVSELAYNNIYNGSEVLVKIPDDSPNFVRYNYIDNIANMMLPVYTTLTGITNCDEVERITPIRLDYDAILGGEARLGRMRGALIDRVSDDVYFLICREIESEVTVDPSIDVLSTSVHTSHLSNTQSVCLLSHSIVLGEPCEFYPNESIRTYIFGRHLDVWSEDDRYPDFEPSDQERLDTSHDSVCFNQLVLSHSAILGGENKYLDGPRGYKELEDGLGDITLGDYIFGEFEAQTVWHRFCEITKNKWASDIDGSSVADTIDVMHQRVTVAEGNAFSASFFEIGLTELGSWVDTELQRNWPWETTRSISIIHEIPHNELHHTAGHTSTCASALILGLRSLGGIHPLGGIRDVSLQTIIIVGEYELGTAVEETTANCLSVTINQNSFAYDISPTVAIDQMTSRVRASEASFSYFIVGKTPIGSLVDDVQFDTVHTSI